ncbi:glycoside hydrolase family 172 protein [Novipirellula artificiosorum]|uniref:DUF2961 domain-containing protein n=1 Tax=Novipirellula artificiosorum TaxID=2528016 RepID=A0A5C6DTR8_9BACT|nr:glycoside hydrolase family 172 protein [Novipirellula artificiosorum]TWU39604.1 hypothetical protein Poly41_24590 [Novipirellula artificiosorum]
MQTNRIMIAMLSAIALFSSKQGKTQEPIRIESLLHEMVDRDSVARYPTSDFRLKQDSSYNRESKIPEPASANPQGWFANGDFNTEKRQSNLIRIEDNDGRKEWVLMEDTGPGTIVRSWMPWRGQANPKTTTIIRFYLDGASEPVIEGNQFDLFQGKGMIPFPLAHPSLRSAVSFFPIPYAKSCKVTVSEAPFFFQFTYRKYPQGTPVETFTMQAFEAAAPLIKATCQELLHPKTDESGQSVSFNGTLAPGAERTLSLPEGAAAVRALSVKLGSYEVPATTRSVVLKMNFDGKDTVWCPVGDFFGCGIGLHPFEGWYRRVAEDGTMSSRWTMPYQRSGRISIVNLGDQPVEVQLHANVGNWNWDKSSMYFHAGWRGQYPVPTRPFSDWNYITTQGKGVYVGDTLTVMNPVELWWGEGDEKIFVDGEKFPSIFGTGTEDYYAYSWGGRSTDFYEHPFHSQVRSHRYNKLNRNQSDERNTQGYSTEGRTRALDTMPFGRSLQLDMEVWSVTDCDMGYGVGVYWYGFEETTSNRKPDATEALNVPPLPEMSKNTVPAATKKLGSLTPTKTGNQLFPNATEVEQSEIAAKSEGLAAAAQDLTKIKGTWSNSSQLLVRGRQAGDFVELRIPAQGTVAQKLILHATRSHDFGIVRFTVNEQPAGEEVDLYAAKPIPSGPIKLGEFAPVDNAYLLRAEVVGRNPKSKGSFFGLDCVVLFFAVGSTQIIMMENQ